VQETTFADGFDQAEPLAFGLAAPELATLALALLAGYAVLLSPAPRWLALPLAVALAAAAAVAGWVRRDRRTLLRWGAAALAFALRPRHGAWLLAMGPDDPPSGFGDRPWERWLDDADDADTEEVAAPPAITLREEAAAPARTQLVLVPEAPAGPRTESVEPDSDPDADEDEGEDGDGEGDAGIIVPFHRGDPEGELVVADALAEPPVAPGGSAVFVGATRRVTFFSLNGGSGRTTLATETAALLATRGRHQAPDGTTEPLRVALLDLDLRSATVSVRLGIPQPSVWDWVVSAGGDTARLDEFMVRHDSGLRALLGPQKPLTTGGLTPAHVADCVHELERQGTHFIVIDVAADLSEVTQWVLNAVHDIFVVITPTASGVQDAYRSAEALRRMGLRHKLRYVVNRSRGALDLSETMADLGGRISAEIPYDTRVEDAENAHRLVCGEAGPAAQGISRLAQQLYPGIAPLRSRRRLGWWRRRAG
jgi:MinD-like ATPase involved in chromosome partitioning or flagellar assembly